MISIASRAFALFVSVAVLAPVPTGVVVGAEVNVYSYRQEFLIRPLFDRFTEKTRTKVNVVFAKTGIIERLKAEGRFSPADLVLTVDVSRLQALVEADLVQSVNTPTLKANVPASFRHPNGLWYGLTMRARVIYYALDRVDPAEVTRYEDLMDRKWRGRICMRSSRHPYNLALLASIIAAENEAKAEQWARRLRENLARRPQGNDRAQIKAIKEGICDLAIGNSYYYGIMKNNSKKPEQQKLAAAVGLIFPNQSDRGTHVNITGIAMTKSARHRRQAIELMEFLTSPEAQRSYASENYEYPVHPDVPWGDEVASWGRFKPDATNLEIIARNAPRALRVFDRVRFE